MGWFERMLDHIERGRSAIYLFRTSGDTFDSVLRNKKHAFVDSPYDWFPGEIALISKNYEDRGIFESQISYIMIINNIRRASTEEVERYWPGNGGRWNYIVEGSEVFALNTPFDLKEVISGERARRYVNPKPYNKLEKEDQDLVEKHIGMGEPARIRTA
jgi:hypothetical protein